MSTELNDPELEALLAELADTDEARAALLEEHRQLEKDLLRLVDPPPPSDFVQSVMRKVSQAPSRPLSRADVVTGLTIASSTLAAALGVLLMSGGPASFGLALAQLVLTLKSGLVALGSGLGAVWATAALPLAIALPLMVWLSLSMLRRAAQPPTAKVLP